MLGGRDVIYEYDGTFDGFLCCVYEYYYSDTNPFSIKIHKEYEPVFYEIFNIETDSTKAKKVYDSIESKISLMAQNLVKLAFMSCLKDKEINILNFLKFGYKNGRNTMKMISHPEVSLLLGAKKHLFNEAHNLKGFVRFSDYNGSLVAIITPKNYVLPFIKNHFCSRYSNENFLIFDKTHKSALVHSNKSSQIISLESLQLPEVDENELNYRELWKKFYDTIAITERENPRCRMSHMPKRYWKNMTEMQNHDFVQVDKMKYLEKV